MKTTQHHAAFPAEIPKHLRGALSALGFLVLISAPLGATNLILDGGFEDPAVDTFAVFHTGDVIGGAWTVLDTTFDVAVKNQTYNPRGLYPQAFEGKQYLYLGDAFSNSTIYQDVRLNAGTPYFLTLSIAGFTDPDFNSPSYLHVDFSHGLGEFTIERDLHLNWEVWVSFNIYPTTTEDYRISFSSRTGSGVFLDGISLTPERPSGPPSSPVPEPSTYGIGAAGVLVLLCSLRRFRRTKAIA